MLARVRGKAPSAGRAQRAQESAQFRAAVQSLVSDLDRAPDRVHSCAALHERYALRRRRAYDVVNVFVALGCAARRGADGLVWYGRPRIFAELRAEKARLGVDDCATPLSALFPRDAAAGLTPLTSALLLLFTALRTDALDLRRVSAFLSRGTGGYKSTLCKLYQIALILGALGITEKGNTACEVTLLSPFTQLLRADADAHPMAIANLLSRPVDSAALVDARRQEFHGIAVGPPDAPGVRL